VLLLCLTLITASGQTIITTIAGSGSFGIGPGSFSGDGGPATSATLDNPLHVAVDASGNLFIADTFNHRIRKVSASGIITTVAGNGTGGFSGDGGPATSAELNQPSDVAVDASGNLFIADAFNNRIRMVSAGGIITTVAGSGNVGNVACCFSGDGGPATSAYLNYPRGIAVDGSGNLFIADSFNNRIRKVSVSGIITTVAGGGPGANSTLSIGYYAGGFSGDGGPATSAQLADPYGVAVDTTGNLFIADSYNNRIRKVSVGGIITTVAGSGNFFIPNPSILCCPITGGYSGDGGPATSALLNTPYDVAVDASDNLFIVEPYNQRIRHVSPSGMIMTVAGNGNAGFSGDDGPATLASLYYPSGVAVDASGDLFIADTESNRIREVQTVTALGGLQNAASYVTGAVAPGEVVVLYGAGMGPAALTAGQIDSSSGVLETTIAGTTVLFNGMPAPIEYTSAGLVSVIVPNEIAGAAMAELLVNYQGNDVAAATVAVAPSAPGIFTIPATGQGNAILVFTDPATNAPAIAAPSNAPIGYPPAPIPRGTPGFFYVTGLGAMTPPVVDGSGTCTASNGLCIANATPQVLIGGVPAQVAFAGQASEYPGVFQVNITVPENAPTGNNVSLVVKSADGSVTSNTATIAVQ
jgi:uncharacterized protein (TIGR03437 family)